MFLFLQPVCVLQFSAPPPPPPLSEEKKNHKRVSSFVFNYGVAELFHSLTATSVPQSRFETSLCLISAIPSDNNSATTNRKAVWPLTCTASKMQRKWISERPEQLPSTTSSNGFTLGKRQQRSQNLNVLMLVIVCPLLRKNKQIKKQLWFWLWRTKNWGFGVVWDFFSWTPSFQVFSLGLPRKNPQKTI